MAQFDLAAVLQILAQQQAALLQARAESLRLQYVLIEHLVGGATDGTPALISSTPAAASTSAAAESNGTRLDSGIR